MFFEGKVEVWLTELNFDNVNYSDAFKFVIKMLTNSCTHVKN